MTNNEKMIELYGQVYGKGNGICNGCTHLGNNDVCDIGHVKINRYMPACGKFEEDSDD